MRSASTPVIDRTFGTPRAKRKQEAEELTWELEERISRVQPPMQPWDYLGERIYSTLESAWPKGAAEVVLGSAENDHENALELLEAVRETADREGFPEPPLFEVDDMAAFIRAWRGVVMERLERGTRTGGHQKKEPR